MDEKTWTVPDEFHFVSGLINSAGRPGDDHRPPAFLDVMSRTALPCAVRCLLPEDDDHGGEEEDGDDGGSFDVDAPRHAKRGFRILWDGARYAPASRRELPTPRRPRASCYFVFLLRTLNGAFRTDADPMRKAGSSARKESTASFDRAPYSASEAAGGRTRDPFGGIRAVADTNNVHEEAAPRSCASIVPWDASSTVASLVFPE